jgi:hypothetical protein
MRERIKKINELWNWVCSVDSGLADRVPTQIINLSVDSTGTVEIRVMERNQHPIGCEVHIRL